MEWGMPQYFVWVWTVPAIVAAFLFASFRKRRTISAFGDLALVERLIASFHPAKRLAKRILILTAVFLLVLALCQPHFKTKETLVERKGIDVIVALDVSKSMLAKDTAPNRLEKAKLELATLVGQLKQDRIGIVAFAGEAFIQCPLTLDKNAVKIFLSSVSPNLIPTPGTALGTAIQVAMQAFGDQEKGFKAVILLTDGEDQGSSPMQAAARASAAGIRIFTIGIGTGEGSTLPGDSAGEGFKKDSQGRPVLSKLDEPLLKAIARETGGVYYRSTRGELEVDHLVHEIRQMVQKGLKTEKSVEYEENYQFFLLTALILLWAEMVLSERRKEGPGAKASRVAVMLLLAAAPFFCGFKFYSALKNEEGNRHYKKGEIGKAKTDYLKALGSEPGSVPVAFNLGNAYYKEASYEDSLKTYKTAAGDSKDPRLQSGAFYNLGNTLYRLKETDRAAEFYKRALRLNPKDEDAKFNLELLKKKENQKKQNEEKQKNQENQQKQQNQQNQKNPQSQQNSNDQEKQGRQDGQTQEDQKNQEGFGGGGEEQKEQTKPETQKKEGSPAEDREPGKEPEPPKTPGQMRADQILDALENQERKALKVVSGSKNAASKQRRTFEKDW
jgi:Ca-activated chloride channel family protein